MARKSANTGILEAQMRDRGVYEPVEFEAWLAERGWGWKALERGDYGVTVDESLVLFTFEDPMRWAETFLFEPDTGEPYRFWDYQRDSVRSWMQDVVHQDGAECGKTREIIALIAWAGCTAVGGRVANPWSLVAAPQQTHLDEIILALEEQFGVAEGLGQKTLINHFWLKPKRTPHVMHRFLAPNPINPSRPSIARTYYRPGGHDGEAFRGVHVNAFGLFDEAAKVKNKTIFNEFWRALKPGCRSRVYSVPDGDRSTAFFRLTQQAIPNLPAGKQGNRLFRWTQTLKPAPFWSAERDAEMVRRFGGRNTPGYQRNVLGEHGQAENPVWPWGDLLPNVVDLPDYRVVKLHADSESGDLNVEVQAVKLSTSDGRKVGEYRWLEDGLTLSLRELMAGNDAHRRRVLRDLLRPHVAGAGQGVFWAGADLGERNDPTEIILSEEVGTVLRDQVRIQARGFPYHLQEELIAALDGLYAHLPFWGIDLGSAGTVVVKDLIGVDRFADCRFEDRLVGFHFQQSVECIGEDGEMLEDDDRDGERRVLTAPAKHWATQCITHRLQAGGYALPYDTDAMNSMATQTARAGAKWPIYSKQDDHHPDARRQQMLRKLRALMEGGGVDVFACGAVERRAA